ncbi:flagella synthesis protein FlgN [Lonsdalea quercina]|uniref:Flagella synthesis protein FlgN n=1 Tax=Lonsdalea quercina TaxID=71657 RepID=A0A1H3VIQ9_9GAMM|nr:flagellar export chaperone FlgN [Lonsdalea quercina]SDZ74655.1 flagella synthesis protein FlgN [Lonsdalea quercina]
MQMNEVLEQMLNSLVSLKDILSQEQDELSARQVNPSFLHRVTENKNEQLSILKHFDNQRLTLDAQLSIRPPYPDSPQLNAQWSRIHELTRELSQNNHRNGLLLNAQLENNQQLLGFLEQKQSQGIYGPNGQAKNTGTHLGRKFSV